MSAASSDIAPAIPAATLVVFRDVAGGAPELLMVERAKQMVFAGGALVFPGGRIDPGDHALATAYPGDPDDIAARIAAIRETIEEAGLAIGLAPPPSAAALTELRRALHDGVPLADALVAARTRLDLNQLVPFARWLPQHVGMRIFDTRFYLARLPADAPAASVDATENVRLLWASAAQVLADADAGRATIIFPTRRNLERLAQFADFAASAAHARATAIVTVTPFPAERDGVAHLCIPEGIGYPVTAEPMAAAMRG